MDMLPSKYIRVSYFWPKSAKKSFCVWRVSKKLKKIEKNFEKILNFFFHKNNSQYNIWIVPTFGVPQITLEGSRDQNPYKVGSIHCKLRFVILYSIFFVYLFYCPSSKWSRNIKCLAWRNWNKLRLHVWVFQHDKDYCIST